MSRTVQCVKLNKEAEGLERPVYPGELGQKIYDNISKEAWASWVRWQTILMNENRLNPMEPKHRTYLEEQMHKFLFEGGSDMPEDFVPLR